MSDRPWWISVLQWTVVSLFVSLLTGWLATARRPAQVTTRGVVLKQPTSSLVLGGTTTAGLLGFTIMSAIYAKPHERWVPYLFGSFLVICGLPLLVESLRVRHELTDAGIHYAGMYRTYPMVPWSSLRSVRWNTWSKWLVIETQTGAVLRFSGMLNGLDALAIFLERHAPELECDPFTRSLLADAREGKLPRAW